MSPRQQQVFALVGQGLGDKEIAQALVIPSASAKSHLEVVKRKLGVQGRARVIAWYWRSSGVLEEDLRALYRRDREGFWRVVRGCVEG